MNQSEIQETIDRYNSRLDRFGVSEQALGWGEKGRSTLRFEILLSRWDFSGASVVDFGCGFGDLFGYMKSRGFVGVDYTGIDINQNLIEIAKQKHPDAIFQVANIAEETSCSRYDFALSSGLFNYKLADNLNFVRAAFAKFARISRKGFACNFVSDRVEYRLENVFHADPCQMLELGYEFSNNVVLRNDYMPYEFSIFVDVGSAVNPELTVFEEFVRYV